MKSRKEIAEVLKECRLQAGFSAHEVASLLNQKGCPIRHRSVYNWESGHGQPDANTFLLLCDIYGIKDIMHAFGYEKKAPQSAPLIVNTDTICLLEKLNRLDTNGRRQVSAYIKENVTPADPDGTDNDENEN